ncbi:putative aldehyde dehydrogenase FUS7 [Colletotrichum siamense]|uniref:aldehyde dehydrogenase (NAD(+)) n=1 Tax=Colletotrichum siamense TaxID=690259 RepID=A0A9P5K611_COLSI|nr:putative aldehyde dehydrogenase FUS7 [Colletotrichum siamense]KAF4860054.1 putative aldehyde dehydrogenase FUS7 [Colletotrichum siamense]
MNGTDSTLSFSTFCNVIDGASTTTTETRHGINPSTLEANPEVPISQLEDVDRAVKAARKAFGTWRLVPEEDRRKAVAAFAASLGEHLQDFATMLVKEQGRPMWGAQMEVSASVDRLAATAKIPLPETVVEDTEKRQIVTRYTPLGVVCAIVPWNFPINLACTKLGAALVAGNAIILKPSPFTPYCGLKLCELAQRFFPPGVVQCLSGDDRLGPWLTAHPDIDKISFTGSTETGRKVMESCSRGLKRVTLELGGNDAAVVFPDVDVASTATAIAQTCLFNTSQVCLTIKRIYVHTYIYPQFLQAFSAVVESFKPSDGFAEVSGDTSSATTGKGYFIAPVVVDSPPDDAPVVTQEPFGPIIPLLTWSDEEDVIQRANDSKLGLAASVWTQDLGHGAKVARRLEAGSVWINNHMDLGSSAPFGGHKESGFGVEGGLAGIIGYCNSQTLYVPKK